MSIKALEIFRTSNCVVISIRPEIKADYVQITGSDGYTCEVERETFWAMIQEASEFKAAGLDKDENYKDVTK